MRDCDWEVKRLCIGEGVVSGCSNALSLLVAGVRDVQPREQQ